MAILILFLGGCASQMLPGKVVFVDRVVDGRRANSVNTGANMGISAAAQDASAGTSLSSAGPAGVGVGVGVVAWAVDALINSDKTVAVFGRLLSGTKFQFNQKPTPEIFQFRIPGERGVYALDKQGDLVLIPYTGAP